MKAMIFAAGLGTRMRPLTDSLPKALVPFKGKPLLDHIVALLPEVHMLVLNTHHHAEALSNYITGKAWPFPVKLSYEQKILGTGGGLHRALPMLADDDFILLNCDILCRPDYAAIRRRAAITGADIVLLVSDRPEASRLVFDETGALAGHEGPAGIRWINAGKKPVAGNRHAKAFCGISYFTRRGAVLFQEQRPCFSIIDSYLDLAGSGAKIIMHDIGALEWIDLGTKERLEKQEAISPR